MDWRECKRALTVPQLRLDRRYLVFTRTRRWPELSVDAYEIDAGGKLRNISPEFAPETVTDNLHGFPLVEARNIILAAPPRGRQPKVFVK